MSDTLTDPHPQRGAVGDARHAAFMKILRLVSDEVRTFDFAAAVEQILIDFERESLAASRASEGRPIPMVLHCPECGTQHVDEPDEQCEHTLQLYCHERCVLARGHEGEHLAAGDDIPEKLRRWTNPPHKSHLCHNGQCVDEKGRRTVWRPADVPTVGVASVSTRGDADTWPPRADAGGAGAEAAHPLAVQCTCGACKAFREAVRAHTVLCLLSALASSRATEGRLRDGLQQTSILCRSAAPVYSVEVQCRTLEQAQALHSLLMEARDVRRGS